jgi:chaperonin GroES
MQEIVIVKFQYNISYAEIHFLSLNMKNLDHRPCFLYIEWNKYQYFNNWRRNMKVKPLGDRVLVKLEKSEAKTAGGIIIPDTAQEKTQQGTGVDVGPGDDKVKVTVKAGQKVMYDKYAGTQIKIEGEEFLILKMGDIIAAIE